jgi:hypothetical protein
MTVLFNLLILISLNPNLSGSLPGEWIGGDGFSQFPALSGNVYVNPALADTQDCLSVNFRLFSDDYSKIAGNLSSVFFNIPLFSGIVVGGNFNTLYDCLLQAYTEYSDDDYTYDNYFNRKGGLYRFGGYVAKPFGILSLGMDFNFLNGKSDDIWLIDFDDYYDVYDTVTTHFRGYSVGFGFSFDIAQLSFGGYYCPYHEIERQYGDEEKEEFDLDSPLRFGFNYSFADNKKVMFSIDRREGLIGLNYGFIRLGYGKIYSMGNGVDVNANRFLGGIFFNISELPLSLMFENRRYSGDFADSEFIVNIGILLSGKGRKNGNEINY